MKLAWESLDRKLDTAVRLNRELVTRAMLTRVKPPVRRLTASLILEAVSAFFILLGLGTFIFAHATEPRFAWPAVLLDVWTIAYLGATIRQLFVVFSIDYDEPVVEIQERIENLGVLRLRAIRWALLTGQIVWWLPFLVVGFKGLSGVDAYQAFGYRFFYINGLASGLMVPLSLWLAKKFSQHLDRSPLLQKVAQSLEGNNIRAALASIAAISAFQSES